MTGSIENPKSQIENPPPLLVSLGECLVEFSRQDDGSFRPAFAGDAFNVLFYAGRLGLRTGFISALGDDLFTPMILEGIEREGVDTSCLLQLSDRRNGIYFIELDKDGEYTFHFWRSGSAATQTLLHHDIEGLVEYIRQAKFFLVSGVGLAVLEGTDRLHTILERVQGTARVVFDTNYRPRLWDNPEIFRRRMEEILPFVDIFLPTASDLRAIFPSAGHDALLEQFSRFDIGAIVMKTGADGCIFMRDGSVTTVAPPPLEQVIDTTGAGDAFNAGFLAGMARELSIEECCMLGHRVAARALQVHGALDHDFNGSIITSTL